MLEGTKLVIKLLEDTGNNEELDDLGVGFAVIGSLVDLDLVFVEADEAVLATVVDPTALVGVVAACAVDLMIGFGVWIVLVVLKLSDVLRIVVLFVVGIATVLALVMVNVVSAPVYTVVIILEGLGCFVLLHRHLVLVNQAVVVRKSVVVFQSVDV